MVFDAVWSVAVAGIFGAFVGSFLNVCIHRLPRNESVVHPPSRCYACGARVRWYDNLPVIGYLVLRGRCRWCGSPFSIRYLLLEVVVAALTAGTVWTVLAGWHTPAKWLLELGLQPAIAQAIAAGSLLLLMWFLLVATVIDIDHLIIPDELTKSFQLAAPFAAIAVASNLNFAWNGADWLIRFDVFQHAHVDAWGYFSKIGGITAAVLLFLLLSLPLAKVIYSRYCPEGERWRDEDHRGFRWGVGWFVIASVVHLSVLAILCAKAGPGPEVPPQVYAIASLGMAILGSLAGWMSLYMVGLLGTVAFRKNAMGFGDVKFLAPIGAWLGPVGVVLAFFGAAVAGSLIGLPLYLMGGKRTIPFGPYLALGAVLTLLFGDVVCRYLLAPLLGGT